MIAYIKGVLEEIKTGAVVIDNNGIGYEISVPDSLLNELPVIGDEMKIYTYLHVREDVMQLFGFLEKSDVDMFRLLITVSGIGPKGALGILSVLSSEDLRFAILAGDVKTISSAPGIGKKTAEKAILELKDKVKLEDTFETKLEKTQKKEQNSTSLARQEAAEALVALGYNQSEALKAIRKVDMTADMNTETLLKLALKNIM